MKIKAINIKGGRCNICGYNKCLRALHFHHLDPKEKEFGLSVNHGKSWASIEKELKKCVLLCANCHMEVHDNITHLPD